MPQKSAVDAKFELAIQALRATEISVRSIEESLKFVLEAEDFVQDQQERIQSVVDPLGRLLNRLQGCLHMFEVPPPDNNRSHDNLLAETLCRKEADSCYDGRLDGGSNNRQNEYSGSDSTFELQITSDQNETKVDVVGDSTAVETTATVCVVHSSDESVSQGDHTSILSASSASPSTITNTAAATMTVASSHPTASQTQHQSTGTSVVICPSCHTAISVGIGGDGLINVTEFGHPGQFFHSRSNSTGSVGGDSDQEETSGYPLKDGIEEHLEPFLSSSSSSSHPDDPLSSPRSKHQHHHQQWVEYLPRHPPPDASLDSPVVTHLLSTWTAEEHKIQYLAAWGSALGGPLPDKFPTAVQLVRLPPVVKDGFLMLLLPILRNGSIYPLRAYTRVTQHGKNNSGSSPDASTTTSTTTGLFDLRIQIQLPTAMDTAAAGAAAALSTSSQPTEALTESIVETAVQEPATAPTQGNGVHAESGMPQVVSLLGLQSMLISAAAVPLQWMAAPLQGIAKRSQRPDTDPDVFMSTVSPADIQPCAPATYEAVLDPPPPCIADVDVGVHPTRVPITTGLGQGNQDPRAGDGGGSARQAQRRISGSSTSGSGVQEGRAKVDLIAARLAALRNS